MISPWLASMIASAILNIILDPIFIYTLGLGVKGAAIATLISSLFVIFVLFYWFYIKNCVVYTGTHDNDTSIGWFNNASSQDAELAKRYMNMDGSEGFNWHMIRLAMMSVADTAIIPMTDLLSFDSDGRINQPSTLGINWKWRMQSGWANDWLAGILFDYTKLYSRLPE